MDELNTLQSLGLGLPSPAYLSGVILFSIAGYAAYRRGKKAELSKLKWLGLALMLFPYVVSETWLLYLIGGGLCAALYACWHD